MAGVRSSIGSLTHRSRSPAGRSTRPLRPESGRSGSAVVAGWYVDRPFTAALGRIQPGTAALAQTGLSTSFRWSPPDPKAPVPGRAGFCSYRRETNEGPNRGIAGRTTYRDHPATDESPLRGVAGRPMYRTRAIRRPLRPISGQRQPSWAGVARDDAPGVPVMPASWPTPGELATKWSVECTDENPSSDQCGHTVTRRQDLDRPMIDQNYCGAIVFGS